MFTLQTFGAVHMETSAKTGQNIEEVMQTLVRKICSVSKPKKKGGKCSLI